MAECHPVGFQWVMEAKRRGATIIHVDPRFTRTSAVADLHVPIRAGSDIAFLGALINYVLTNELDFREYVVHYTNAAAIVDESFRDTEDLDGLFSGWDEATHRYDLSSWQYAGAPTAPPPVNATRTSRADRRQFVLGGRATRMRQLNPRPPGPVARRSRTSRSGTRPCSTRAACTRSSSGTSPGIPQRWSRRPAASAAASSTRWPGR
jgi:hypothetical protein